MKSYILLLLLIITPKVFSQNIVIMTGIETQKSSASQISLLKKGFPNKKIIGFKHNNIQGLLNHINNNPKDIIILYSLATKHTSLVTKQIKNKSNLWIVEPPFAYKNQIVKSTLIGLKTNHIIVGPKPNRGFGIIDNPLFTPKGVNHFDCLTYLSNVIKD